MLTYCRPHGGEGEKKFVERFIKPYRPLAMLDDKGEVLAWCVRVGEVENAPVLWSGHVDTMHKPDAPAKQSIVYDEGCGMIYKDDKVMPLGADNGAGVWLMLEMLDAGVPGTYLFHRGEERGGIGSSGMAKKYDIFLKQFKYAIAFDRRGTGDVITEQMCGVCCSDEFALALAALLNTNVSNVSMGYKPDDTGSFTDTANYIGIIPECTNVSVGYDNEHTPNETLDVWHLMQLRDAVIAVFKTGIDLPVVRDPSIVVDRWGGFGSFGDNYDYPLCAAEVLDMPFKDLVKLVKTTHPEDIAELLLSLAEEASVAEAVEANDSQYMEKDYALHRY